MSQENIVNTTRSWVESVVVGLNFCPFARREVDRGSLQYVVLDTDKRRDILEGVLDECHRLDENPDIETILVILPQGQADFSHYLDLLEMVEELLVLEGYEGVYQVASFHPEYCFADADVDDPANYTNRSPYPMLHLLREESLEKAIAAHPDAEGIPPANIDRARGLGLAAMQELLRKSRENG